MIDLSVGVLLGEGGRAGVVEAGDQVRLPMQKHRATRQQTARGKGVPTCRLNQNRTLDAGVLKGGSWVMLLSAL